MNIILVDSTEVSEKALRLTDIRAEHIVKVLKSDIGETVRVGIIDGGKGSGTIISIGKKRPFYVELELHISNHSIEIPPLDLILALPRPIMLKRILTQLTALGVGMIHLIHANRVEKSFWNAGVLDENEYRVHLLHGLEQAVDTRVPEVHIHRKFKPFIEDYFPGQVQKYGTCILAHPSGKTRLSDVVQGGNGRIALAIGPEGGWVDYEVEQFKKKGFCSCTIGERILKVDTAVIALHSRISALVERNYR